ncbi:hypothetical protein RAZWK3B_11892 [Roseobacter sp. AzwK-3b]|nr:hypothetical protein RAZWK3B_11892 [Roseobacter sp. AzwK-3b]
MRDAMLQLRDQFVCFFCSQILNMNRATLIGAHAQSLKLFHAQQHETCFAVAFYIHGFLGGSGEHVPGFVGQLSR